MGLSNCTTTAAAFLVPRVKSELGPQPIRHVDASNAVLRPGERGIRAGSTGRRAQNVGQDGGLVGSSWLRPGFGPPAGISVCLLLHLLENFPLSLLNFF